jgi:hypothetical protein
MTEKAQYFMIAYFSRICRRKQGEWDQQVIPAAQSDFVIVRHIRARLDGALSALCRSTGEAG